jgi:hypothetical protein
LYALQAVLILGLDLTRVARESVSNADPASAWRPFSTSATDPELDLDGHVGDVRSDIKRFAASSPVMLRTSPKDFYDPVLLPPFAFQM